MVTKRGASTTQHREAMPGPMARAQAYEIIHSLGAAFSDVKVEIEKIVRPHNLTGPVGRALLEIDGSISMKELGGRLGYDASFLTAIADGLEERGLARREVDPDDRRSKRLVLTRKGSALKARLDRAFLNEVPWMNRLDEQERKTFLDLLRKMAGDRSASSS
jgi:MarR family transcriptional regulator, organic hydroperoxide resistance regulator